MIEIKCTEKQKEIIINALCEADSCASIVETVCGYSKTSCVDCIEKRIKWDIQPEPLKPCPCCGGKAAYVTFTDNTYVSCKSCHLQTTSYNTEKQAAEIWNRRIAS